MPRQGKDTITEKISSRFPFHTKFFRRGIDAQFLVAVATRSQEPTNPLSAWHPINALRLQFSSEDFLIRAGSQSHLTGKVVAHFDRAG